MDQLNTRLLDLMKTSGVREVRRVLGKYVQQLKSGVLPRRHQAVSDHKGFLELFVGILRVSEIHQSITIKVL